METVSNIVSVALVLVVFRQAWSAKTIWLMFRRDREHLWQMMLWPIGVIISATGAVVFYHFLFVRSDSTQLAYGIAFAVLALGAFCMLSSHLFARKMLDEAEEEDVRVLHLEGKRRKTG